MKTRIITALIGIPIVLFIVHAGGFLLFAVTLLCAILAARELELATRHRGDRVDALLIYPAVVWILVRTRLWPADANLLWLVGAALLATAVLTYNQPWRLSLGTVAMSLLAALYVGLFAFIPLLRQSTAQGQWLMWLLLCGVWTGDTVAYFAGRAFGRRKLTALSPGKTVEGAIAGFIAAVVACALLGARPLGVMQSVMVGAIIGIAAPLGDLVESYWKRELGLKDLGTLLPGHGGILDRCDSLIFAAGAVYIYVAYYGPG